MSASRPINLAPRPAEPEDHLAPPGLGAVAVVLLRLNLMPTAQKVDMALGQAAEVRASGREMTPDGLGRARVGPPPPKVPQRDPQALHPISGSTCQGRHGEPLFLLYPQTAQGLEASRS